MENTEFSTADSLRTWGLLVAFLLVSVLVVALGASRTMALWVIFAAAAVQVFVIGRYYMLLRSEDVFIYTLALLPVALAIVLAFVLMPDVATYR